MAAAVVLAALATSHRPSYVFFSAFRIPAERRLPLLAAWTHTIPAAPMAQWYGPVMEIGPGYVTASRVRRTVKPHQRTSSDRCQLAYSTRLPVRFAQMPFTRTWDDAH